MKDFFFILATNRTNFCDCIYFRRQFPSTFSPYKEIQRSDGSRGYRTLRTP